MKKILSISVVVLALIAIAAPMVLAQETAPTEISSCTMRHDLTGTSWTGLGITCAARGSSCLFSSATQTCGACCLMDTIYTVTNWIFLVIIIIAGIFILLGAFNIITAGGSPEKVNSGRSYIIYAVAGVIVALLAKAIPLVARNILGM